MRLNEIETNDKAAFDGTKTQKKLDKYYSLNIVSDTANAAKESVNGVLIGAVTGLVGAYFLQKNIYWGAAFGGLVGGLLGYSAAKV